MKDVNFLLDMIKNFWIYHANPKQSHHNYAVGYYEFLKNLEVNTMLEIGVCEGYSMLAWSKIFPNAKIFGIDWSPNHMAIPKLPNVTTMVGDQNSVESLLNCVKQNPIQYDFILDDGGHQFSQGKNCFEVFFPQLAPGGVYIVEDIMAWNNGWQQTTHDWIAYLSTIPNINYTMIDCHYNDLERYPGSSMVAITRK